ncbi:hypothetical protein [Algoriphagus sp. CAU 1675]|uniref:hypothetical protein n=1 Tax=Algoriphagus sp. CAU 1675 TaxID=3032597 RepID=UPI0023DAAD36|nr:hypothetical protein [Algoriphagus sp. CAU 1675]MDF2156709.1 hypothetical protein [Algoriphagus sp. CAU 1675]
MKKHLTWLSAGAFVLASLTSGAVFAQDQETDLQYFRQNSKEGLNVFETPKEAKGTFEKVKVVVGGDFALQFQSINHSNALNNLVDLGSNINLPTANLNINTQLADGLRLHLRTYLSAKHHNEAWVKGGHMQIDKLDFIKPGFLEEFMKVATITVGMDEFNYGDAHFRRSDNARVLFNPFVGNYIMDSFSTEAFGEVTIQSNGFIGVVGVTNGKLNQSVVVNSTTDNKLSFYGKLGFDKQINEDFRFRLTGSWYMNNGLSTGTYLYGGDRGGSRYYGIMQALEGTASDFEGRFNPRFKQMTAIQINPFIKFKGLEFFGIIENVGNSEDQGNGSFTQLAGEALYRFGTTEQFYLGGRYNTVSGNSVENGDDIKINRVNIGGGWFMTNNVLIKLEYMNQQYKEGFAADSKYNGGEFKGVNIEAAISF